MKTLKFHQLMFDIISPSAGFLISDRIILTRPRASASVIHIVQEIFYLDCYLVFRWIKFKNNKNQSC
jgi:hypothetical protein